MNNISLFFERSDDGVAFRRKFDLASTNTEITFRQFDIIIYTDGRLQFRVSWFPKNSALYTITAITFADNFIKKTRSINSGVDWTDIWQINT